METIIHLENADIYQQDHLVLSNVSLKINKGEFVYLIGRTGSGKTSLLRTLYCDIRLRNGAGRVAGYDLTAIGNSKVPYFRRKIGIVFQDFRLLTDRNVDDNLLFVMKATGWKDEKKMHVHVSQTLSLVGLSTKGFKMPYELSGGEQQRVAIARALINDPDIILADEPTGNLDMETSFDIIKLLQDISKAWKAVVVATHNYTLFGKFPARTLKCEDGKILETGTQ